MSYIIDWATYDITDIFSPSSVFSMSGKINRQGKFLIGNITVTRNSGTFGDFASNIGTFAKGFRPKYGVVTYAVLFSDHTESATSQTGYCRADTNGGLVVSGYGTTGKTRARIELYYEIA